MRDGSFRYWAFVSYSSKDAAVARRLCRRLETYRVPRSLRGRPGRDGLVPARVFPIFRDRDELPLSSDLGASIEDALQASRYLIVLCSPDAAASRWVNEEVRIFKRLGRADRILAVIVRGEPPTCFPPALREGPQEGEEVEPIGGDLRAGGDGWRRVVLKAVAGITGLGFDAFARRDARRQRVRRLVAAAALLVAATAGVAAWDHNRLKEQRVAHVQSRFGALEGVVSLDDATASRRQVSYLVSSRRGKVREVRRVDGAGQLAEDSETGAATRRLFYREDGSIETIEFLDRHGKLVKRDAFSESRETVEGPVHFVHFRREHRDAPFAIAAAAGSLYRAGETDAAQRSEITSHEVAYDSRGRIARIAFLNAYQQRRPNQDGVFGQAFEYSGESALPTAIITLGFDGRPQAGRDGVARMTISRSARGDIVERRYFTLGGRPALTREGFHAWRVSLDEVGNAVAADYVAADGTPAMHADGYFRVRANVDTHGRQTQVSYWMHDGTPARDGDGFHRIDYEWDGEGNRTTLRYWDIENRPAVHSLGHHIERWRYEDGHVRETSYFGPDGSPSTTLKGYHGIRYRTDAAGRVVERAYLDARGNPIAIGTGEDGTIGRSHHAERYTYDGNGALTALAYVTVDGRPGWAPGSLAELVTFAYDQHGNLTETVYARANGTPLRSPLLGYAIHRRRVDERGSVIEESFFGETGQPALATDGIHRATWTRDARGNLVEVAMFGASGERVASSAIGVHMGRFEHDQVGNPIVASFFGPDQAPASMLVRPHELSTDASAAQTVRPRPIRESYHRVVRTYDGASRKTKEAFFTGDGKPVRSAINGVHEIRYTYEQRATPTAEAYFDADGRPAVDRRRIHRRAFVRDAGGRAVEEAYFDGGGSRVLVDGEFHRLRRVFTPLGQVREEAYFGLRDEPVVRPSLVHRVRRTFDTFGELTEERYFGIDGNPTLNRNGFHRAEFASGERGRTDERYYDVAGRRVVRTGGSRIVHNLFVRLDFLMAKDAVILVVPADLPEAPLTVYVTRQHLSFMAGDSLLADLTYLDADGTLYARMRDSKQFGIVEFVPGSPFPNAITAVADCRLGSPPGLR